MSFVRNCPSTSIVVLCTLCLLVPNFVCQVQAADDQLYAADLRDMIAAGGDGRIVGHPRRPDSFRTIDELNQYLADMRKYYSMLGRPR